MKLLQTPAERVDEVVPGAGALLETAAHPRPPGDLGTSPCTGRT